MKIKYICKLCNKEFDGTRNFTGHLKLHKISSREYYDKFLKKPDDGICQVCGKPTVFLSLLMVIEKHVLMNVIVN